MATNYVEIQIKASDTAKPDLTDLKAKLDELGAKVETAKVDVDDADGTAKLLAMNAKLAALNAKVANPKISISGAAKAEADIAALDAQMRAAGKTSDDAKTRFGAFGQAVNALTLGVPGGISEMSMFQKAVAGLGIATGIGEPLIAGLTVAVGSLGAGLVSAGAGLGAFGVIAKSNFTAAGTAAKQVQTAQDTYNASIAAGVKQATAYKAEQKAIGLAYAELTPAQITLSKQIGTMSNQWQSFTAGFAPMLSGMLGKIQPVLGTIFGAIGKLATSAGTAIQALLPSLDMAIKSSGFQKFITMLADNAGPAIVKLGVIIGNVARGIGGILSAFMPMSQGMLSGIEKITAAFAKWGTTLSSHTGFQSMMSTFKTETPQAVAVLKNLAVVVKNVVAGMAGLATGSNSMTLLNVLKPLSGILASLSKNTDLVRIALYLLAAADAGKKLSTAVGGIKTAFGVFKTGASALVDLRAGFTNSAAAASSATGIFGTIGGKISTIGSALATAGSAVASFVAGMVRQLAQAAVATGVWIAEHTVAAAAFIAENVAMAVSATAAFIAENAATLGIIAGIALLIAGIVYLATHWSQVWGTIKSIASDAWNFIYNGFGKFLLPLLGPAGLIALGVIELAKNWTAIWGTIKAVVSALAGFFTSTVPGYFKSLYSGAVSWLSSLLSFVAGIPGKILSALGNLGNLLVNAGKAIIQGLINGIESMFSALGSVASSVGSFIAGLKGPLPKDLVLLVPHGKAIMTGLMNGMTSQLPALHSTLDNVTGTIQGGVGGGAAGGAGVAGPAKVQLELTSSGDQFLVWLRNSIRVKGGNVQSVLGTG
jgi:phage-related protein